MEPEKSRRQSSLWMNLGKAVLSLLALAAIEALATIAVLHLAIHH